MWRKNRVNRTKENDQKRESMALERCVTGMAYELRLLLQCNYELDNAEGAKNLLQNWSAWVPGIRETTEELLEVINQVTRIVEVHFKGISYNWTRVLTTNFKVGHNSLFSAVKRPARGYPSMKSKTAMLAVVAEKLTLPCY